MNAIEHRVVSAARELLDAHRPSGIPQNFMIRAEYDTAKLEKPYLSIAAVDGGSPHPVMRKMVLTLTTQRRADDTDTAPPGELHQQFVNALEANLAALATALAALQLRLMKMTVGATGEEIVAGRACASSTAWTLWLRIADA